MEKPSQIIIITLLFSTIVFFATQNETNEVVIELVSFCYFIGLFCWIYYSLKNTAVYSYLALIYFILILITSFLQKDLLAIICSTFFFYTLISILVSKIFDHFYNEK